MRVSHRQLIIQTPSTNVGGVFYCFKVIAIIMSSLNGLNEYGYFLLADLDQQFQLDGLVKLPQFIP